MSKFVEEAFYEKEKYRDLCSHFKWQPRDFSDDLANATEAWCPQSHS